MEEYIKSVKPDKLIYVEGVNTDSGTKSNCIPKLEWLGSYEYVFNMHVDFMII